MDPTLEAELRAHFARIQRQPQRLQALLLAKLSCGLRLPHNEIEARFRQFCQDPGSDHSGSPMTER